MAELISDGVSVKKAKKPRFQQIVVTRTVGIGVQANQTARSYIIRAHPLTAALPRRNPRRQNPLDGSKGSNF